MLTLLGLCALFTQFNCLGQAPQCGALIKGCNADDAVVCSTHLFVRYLPGQRASESVARLPVLVFSLPFTPYARAYSVIVRVFIVLLSLTACHVAGSPHRRREGPVDGGSEHDN
jgi:hypothetical protein